MLRCKASARVCNTSLDELGRLTLGAGHDIRPVREMRGQTYRDRKHTHTKAPRGEYRRLYKDRGIGGSSL